MIKTLTRHEDALALILDESVLDLLGVGIESDTPLSITAVCQYVLHHLSRSGRVNR